MDRPSSTSLSDESFSVDRDHLVRNVVPRRGTPYEHRCPRSAYEEVAHAAEEMRSGITLDRIHAATGLPFTQVAVALAFLKERGSLAPEHGRTHAAPEGLHLDAMTEFHALREEPRPD
jgi:hypothetical protein